MQTKIVRAQASDVSKVARLNGIVQDLHAAMSPGIFRSHWRMADLRDFWKNRLADENNTVALAVSDGDALGYIWFEVQDRPADIFHLHRRRIYVHHIAVDEKARGRGVGTMLLGLAETEARHLGITTVLLDTWASNTVAQTFFRSQGYGPLNIILTKELPSTELT